MSITLPPEVAYFPLALRTNPTSQDFRHAPGLGHTSPGMERFLCIEDLTDGSDAGLIQMRIEALSMVIWLFTCFNWNVANQFGNQAFSALLSTSNIKHSI